MSNIIIVIDDSANAAELIAHYLEKDGFIVEKCGSGQYGLDLAERLQPALVVCDIRMPGMDGLEFAQKMRQMSALKNVPLVAMTAAFLESDRKRALEAGFDHYIEKPPDQKLFAKIIRSFIRE